MAVIIRLIWRFDFDASYAFFDRRGTALRLLYETVGGFFSNISDGNVLYSFTGETRDNRGVRNISIEPTSINGSLEWYGGINIDRITISDEFRTSDKIFGALLSVYNLKNIKRSGLRTIGVLNSPSFSAKVSQRNLWSGGNLTDLVTTNFGETTDIGIVLEGVSPDHIKYRCNVGPFADKNIALSLTEPRDKTYDKKYREYDVFYDLDLYENNISLLAPSLFRWAHTKFDKVNTFTRSLERYKLSD